jgi:aryl-alcohol dehydrogenase-like predicted oxidoreductase
MHYRQLGNSGLMLSELGLGTGIFGLSNEWGTPPDEAEQMIHRFVDAGGNYLDTASGYAGGRSEEIVGQAIKGKRDQVVLATKVSPSIGGVKGTGLSRYHVMRTVEASLRRLQTETIDLLYMHHWDPITPMEESLRAFHDLVTAGKVRYIGVSNWKAWQVMKALSLSVAQGWNRFAAAQYQYCLVCRDIEREFIDLCQTEGVGLVAWGALGAGFLSGKYRREKRAGEDASGRLASISGDEAYRGWRRMATERNWRVLDAVREIAEGREGTTCAQVAVAWLLAQPAVTSVIVGASNMPQLEKNLGAADLQLTPDEMAKLNEVSAFEEGYPYAMIRFFGFTARPTSIGPPEAGAEAGSESRAR